MTTPEPADKLDTDVVNGPQDDNLDWDAIWWRPVEEDVRRLRQRIFKASQAGDLKRVRNLQKLMLRSRSNTLVSVRRVTQHNAGRKTAGIDGEVALTAPDRAALVVDLHRHTRPGGSTGQAGLHPEGEWEAATTGDSGAAGPGATGPGRQRAGARVGGAVRAAFVRVPARTRLS